MFSCLTEIFLSTAAAERCKISFGQFWVETSFLRTGRAGRRGHVPGLSLCLEGQGNECPGCQAWGMRFGHMLSCFTLQWGCSRDRGGWEQSCSCGNKASSLSRPRQPAWQHSASRCSRGDAGNKRNKPNQRIDRSLKGLRLLVSLFLLIFGAQIATCREKRTGGGGTGKGVVPGVCSWQAGRLTQKAFLSRSVWYRW